MRRLLSIALGAALLGAMAAPVQALSMGLSPSSQTHNHGVASSWSLTWGGSAPFNVFFVYDTSNPAANWFLGNTNTTSKNLSNAFYPCVTKTFTQRMDATDNAGGGGSLYSTAREAGGNPC